MLNQFTLQIADMVISVKAADRSESFLVDSTYQPFLCDRNPEVELLVYTGSWPDWRQGITPIFETHSMWNLYWNGSQWVMPFFLEAGQEPRIVAIYSADFCSGKVYHRESWGENEARYPLTYPIDELLVINLLARKRGVLVHAFAVKDGEEGLLFSGVSGAGKSTSARIWENVAGAKLLSDDRVILSKRDDQFWIYGTPWHGDARIASPEGGPLGRVFIIHHAQENFAARMAPLQVASQLLVRAFPTYWDAGGMEFTLGFLEELGNTVPCYSLGFVPDSSVVDYIRCMNVR